MNTSTLLFALLLPWAAGSVLWWRFANDISDKGRGLRALGFGLFIALAGIGLSLWLMDRLGTGLSTAPVLLASGLVLALVPLLPQGNRERRAASSVGADFLHAFQRFGLPGRALLVLLLFGILVHLAFSTIEILAQPVFPWDGWTIWVYRAKAWFYADALVPIVDQWQWLMAGAPEVYTTPARAYPLLPSLIPLWAALGFGQWHETLVNLPVLACAIAVALALAGCLRAVGVGITGCLLAIYLLYSTPLFGVHMSLGGYADIWLAGYAGIGMTALLCGLITGRRCYLAAALVLLSLGLFVKVEGFVWWLAAFLILLLATVPARWLLVLALAALLIGVLATVAGLTSVVVPGVGRVGYAGGSLWVPFKGPIPIEIHDVGEAYWKNAFLLGSWHLLWPIVLLTLVLLALQTGSRVRKTALAFFGVFIALQVGIFVFTTEGAWARDFTAINRMPLQMLPAIIFLVVAALAERLPGLIARLPRPRPRRALVVGFGAGILLTVLGLVAWQFQARSGVSDDVINITGDDLQFMVGGGVLDGERLQVDRYQDGIALLSSGPVSVPARRFPVLDLELDFDTDFESLDQAPAFFWRRADQPRDVSRITLLDSGLVDLTAQEKWYGEIIEYGFFFVDNDGASATVSGAQLSGRTAAVNLGLIPEEWTEFDTWGQRSGNWLPGGAYDPIVSVTGTVLVAMLLATAVAWLMLGRQALWAPLFVMLGAGWLLLDARWGWDRLRQADLSLAWLERLSVEERLADGELGVYFDYLEALRADHFGTKPVKILVLKHNGVNEYYRLRAKYQLLPHSSAVMSMPQRARDLRRVDYVLVLGNLAEQVDRTGNPINDRFWRRLGMHGDRYATHRSQLELIQSNEQGVLFRTARATP
ncbi:MAG: hypothetical protein AAGH19_08770 [Pseudomonadota bacterium]